MVMAMTVMQALGIMAAAYPVMLLGHAAPAEVACQPLLGCQQAQEALGYHYPRVRERLTLLGVPTKPVEENTAETMTSYVMVFTDASLTGWGGGVGGLLGESGRWCVASDGGPTHKPP